MIVDVAVLGFAAVALWLALRGIVRLVRGHLRVTVASVAHVVLSGAALGVAAWLELADPDQVADTVDRLAAWAGERLGLQGWWERLQAWLWERAREALDALLETLPLR